MKLARNAVFAVMESYSNKPVAFLHINKDDLINPFWNSECGVNGFSLHGEFIGHGAGGHEHWRGVEQDNKLVMVQSHVTKPSDVDFKRCMKFAKKCKRK